MNPPVARALLAVTLAFGFSYSAAGANDSIALDAQRGIQVLEPKQSPRVSDRLQSRPLPESVGSPSGFRILFDGQRITRALARDLVNSQGAPGRLSDWADCSYRVRPNGTVVSVSSGEFISPSWPAHACLHVVLQRTVEQGVDRYRSLFISDRKCGPSVPARFCFAGYQIDVMMTTDERRTPIAFGERLELDTTLRFNRPLGEPGSKRDVIGGSAETGKLTQRTTVGSSASHWDSVVRSEARFEYTPFRLVSSAVFKNRSGNMIGEPALRIRNFNHVFSGGSSCAAVGANLEGDLMAVTVAFAGGLEFGFVGVGALVGAAGGGAAGGAAGAGVGAFPGGWAGASTGAGLGGAVGIVPVAGVVALGTSLSKRWGTAATLKCEAEARKLEENPDTGGPVGPPSIDGPGDISFAPACMVCAEYEQVTQPSTGVITDADGEIVVEVSAGEQYYVCRRWEPEPC